MHRGHIPAVEVIQILEDGKPDIGAIPLLSTHIRSLKIEYVHLIDNMIKKVENLEKRELKNLGYDIDEYDTEEKDSRQKLLEDKDER